MSADNGATVDEMPHQHGRTAGDPGSSRPQLLDVAQLGAWAAQWDRLVDESPLPSPFLRSWWLNGAGGGGRHFLLVVDHQRLLGGLALEQRNRLSSFRVMGDGSLCPDHLDLLAERGHEDAVVGRLREWLGGPGGRLIDLRGVRAGSRLPEALPGRVRREPLPGAPYARLAADAEAFRATLPPQFRRNLRKSAARLAEEGARHRAIRGPALLSSLDTLRELHWLQWGGRSQFLPAFDRFAAACAAGAAVDEVAVHELHTDDLVIASVVTFEVAGRVSLYQSGRLTDARWKDATTALLAAIVDDACSRGFAEVDFLRGEEAYKGRFTTTRRGMDRLVAGSGVIGRLRQAGAEVKLRSTRAAVAAVRAGRSVTRRRS